MSHRRRGDAVTRRLWKARGVLLEERSQLGMASETYWERFAAYQQQLAHELRLRLPHMRPMRPQSRPAEPASENDLRGLRVPSNRTGCCPVLPVLCRAARHQKSAVAGGVLHKHDILWQKCPEGHASVADVLQHGGVRLFHQPEKLVAAQLLFSQVKLQILP